MGTACLLSLGASPAARHFEAASPVRADHDEGRAADSAYSSVPFLHKDISARVNKLNIYDFTIVLSGFCRQRSDGSGGLQCLHPEKMKN